MSAGFNQLLQATLDHLRREKARGVKYVPVDETLLASLARPFPRTQTPGRQAPPSTPSRSRPGSAPVSPTAPTPLRGGGAAHPSEVSGKRLSREEKQTAMAELRERALVCQKCPQLAASRQNVVFGVGDIHASLMFVGEAPGADEDRQGEPFVGAAGRMLTKIIQTMGFSRDTVYIANILKCRPDTPGQATGNRKPTSEEMDTCKPYLLSQIDLIHPQVIVALGATAAQGLLGSAEGITRLRGNWMEFRGIPVMPTFHPSYLLHQDDLATKRKVWEDMLKVLGRLEAPISEKQRKFFLPK